MDIIDISATIPKHTFYCLNLHQNCESLSCGISVYKIRTFAKSESIHVPYVHWHCFSSDINVSRKHMRILVTGWWPINVFVACLSNVYACVIGFWISSSSSGWDRKCMHRNVKQNKKGFSVSVLKSFYPITLHFFVEWIRLKYEYIDHFDHKNHNQKMIWQPDNHVNVYYIEHNGRVGS